MRAVITVTGKDSQGIIARVSTACADHGVNIVDISQSVLQDYFAMIMLADIDKLTIPFADFVDHMAQMGKDKGLDIRTMHEDIFQSMHRI